MLLGVRQRRFTPRKSLLSLLSLVIPGGICIRFRRRICKCCKDDESQTANPPPESIPMCHPVPDPSQGNVAGYPTNPGQGPNYYPPPDQGQIQYPTLPQWNRQPAVPPNPGFNFEYTPQNPLYPPVPGVSPAQPPQWSGPPNQYNPPAPVDYNALMNSASSGPEPLMYQIGASSPAASLLNTQSPAPNILKSSDSADVQFNIDKAKSPTNNFL